MLELWFRNFVDGAAAQAWKPPVVESSVAAPQHADAIPTLPRRSLGEGGLTEAM
jgi:hypothetical protein